MSATAEADVADATTPLYSVEAGRATIRLNRPAKMNRIEPADLAALAEHIAAVDANESVRVLILTGNGKIFSAGYHLGDLDERKSGRTSEPADGPDFEAVANALETCRVPTICALNGSVYGGGTDLALACDFRIGVVDTQMLMPASKLGVHYYLGGMQRYVARLGLAAAKRLFLTARPIDTDEMLRIGYLDDAVQKTELEATVDELAQVLARNAPLSVQHMKRALNDIAHHRVDIGRFTAGHRACMESADLAEGLAAWKARRPPEFAGR
ncbi:MAG: enoyl-CoA hydratase/isomerase family protein [Pseudomonadota bacterium]